MPLSVWASRNYLTVMEFSNWPSLVFLLLLLAFIGRSVFRSGGKQLNTSFKQAGIWAVIFAATIAGAAWYDQNSQRSFSAQSQADDVIELRKRFDGHFHLTADVNGVAIDFIVDTGASQIVLSQDDAARAGISAQDLTFSQRARTANGSVQTAPVILETFSVGPVTDTGVRAVVNGGEMSGSLLGMSYLSRFASIEIAGERLILRR